MSWGEDEISQHGDGGYKKEARMNEVTKLQWSKFSPDRSEQFVVRTDDYDELLDYRSKIMGVLPKANAFPNDDGPVAIAPEHAQKAAPVCKIHGNPMTFRSGVSKKTGKPYGFWSCGQKLADGSWCPEKN